MDTLQFRSKEHAFDYLDDYAGQRKREVDQRRLGKEQGLIKSYVLETLPVQDGHVLDAQAILRGMRWQVAPVGDEGLYHVRDSEGELGLLEYLSPRLLALHTIEETRRADRVLSNSVLGTAQLDFVWLAGSTFETIWRELVLPRMPERFVTFKFEHLARFDDTGWYGEEDELDEEWSTHDLVEHRASTLAITERSSQIERFLPKLQEDHPPFRSIKMLRIPAAETRGGYDLWSWGKVTYRSPTFRDGRSQILSLVRLYEQTTRIIEQRLWFGVETTRLQSGGESASLTGAPVFIEFVAPLSPTTFENFVAVTFERGRGPFRLWGNPIRVGQEKVHVYGIDQHLWKRIFLEITPRYLLFVLPRGTCGNTVHRLVTNVQRFLAPLVRVHVGDVLYSDLVKDVFMGQVRQ